jgi:hypothetical protein
MNRSKKWVVFAVMVLLGGYFLLLGLRAGRSQERRLADGSVLKLEKISYGKGDTFKPGGIVQRLKAILPRKFTSKIFKFNPYSGTSRGWSGNLNDTNKDALSFWFTRRDGSPEGYADVQLGFAEILDEHGCSFFAATAGGENDGTIVVSNGYPAGFCVFQAFPRQDKTFRLRVYDRSSRFLAEFVVPNPAPISTEKEKWIAEPLPATQEVNGVAFTLTGIQSTPVGDFAHASNLDLVAMPEVKPAFGISEGGKPSKAWRLVDVDWSDAFGNLASKWQPNTTFLCSEESAWKLKAKFFGSGESVYASNATWVVKGLKVPAPGEFVAIGATQQVQGVKVEAMALGGAGTVVYSNNAPISASPPIGLKTRYSWSSTGGSTSGGQPFTVYNIQGPLPHVAVHVSNLSSDQRLSIRATDDQGRNFYAEERQWGNGNPLDATNIHYFSSNFDQPLFLPLDLAKDSKTVDLTFTIHQARIVEFLMKPPTSREAQSKAAAQKRP